MSDLEKDRSEAYALMSLVKAGEADASKLEEIQLDLQVEIEDLKAACNREAEKASRAKEKLSDAKGNQDRERQAMAAVEQAAVRIDMANRELDAYLKLSKEVADLLELYRPFDKKTCLQNIRMYLKELDIKVSELENRAGVRVGYLSRLEKEDNRTNPSIEFVATAAKMFGVSVDELLYYKPEDLTETERLVQKFLDKMRADTADGTLSWNKLNPLLLMNLDWDHFGGGMPDGDTLQLNLMVRGENDLNDSVPYRSAFLPDRAIQPTGKAFIAKLSVLGDRVLIIECTSDDVELPADSRVFYEVYIIERNQKRNPLFTSLKVPDAMQPVFFELLRMVEKTFERVQVDDDTKGIINGYLNSERKKKT